MDLQATVSALWGLVRKESPQTRHKTYSFQQLGSSWDPNPSASYRVRERGEMERSAAQCGLCEDG